MEVAGLEVAGLEIPRSRRVALLLIATLTTVTSSAVTSTARAQERAGSTAARLAAGEILIETAPVPQSDTPFYVARGVVEAPPARVWEIVGDCGRYRETMVRVAASTLVSSAEHTTVCRLLMAMPFPLPNLTAVTRATHRAEGSRLVREWQLVEGDFALHEGSWLVEPFEGDARRTLVTHRARVRPKLPVPELLLAGSKKETLRETLENLRRQLVSKAAPAPKAP